MRSAVYSRWDGTQAGFSLDARPALAALADLLMEGQGVREALGWMRRHGFGLAGLEMRVMGSDELAAALLERVQELRDRYRLDRATGELRQRLDEILDAEQEALRESHGYESARLNEFLARRHAEGGGLAEALERFRDHAFQDEEAGRAFRELLEELERLRALEDFVRRRGAEFRGAEAADYETAQEIRERVLALEKLARELAAGGLPELSLEELRELLGEEGARSLIFLRDLEAGLERAGYLRPGPDPQLTPRAIRQLGAQALADVYGALREDRAGGHETHAAGAALPRPDETRPWAFGDPLDLDVVRTLLKGLRRAAAEGRPALPLRLGLDDFELREYDLSTQTTTVLLLDQSWSMSWAGRFAAAKRVTLALDHLIRTRFPRDRFFVVGFSTRAREIRPQELAQVGWDMGDPFTNLQEGLVLAERLIARHPSTSPQVLVITDGQPTAYFAEGQLRVEWPLGFGGVSPRAVRSTLEQVRRITRRGVTINTFMLDDAPELVGFVEHLTQINRGRALYSHPAKLGSYLMVDYLNGRRKRRS